MSGKENVASEQKHHRTGHSNLGGMIIGRQGPSFTTTSYRDASQGQPGGGCWTAWRSWKGYTWAPENAAVMIPAPLEGSTSTGLRLPAQSQERLPGPWVPPCITLAAIQG